MEWVEVTGKTVDEARESALEQLGVGESDAEILVVSEPKTGLFGRLRGEARVRARVRPAGPRPKRNRRAKERSGNDTRPAGSSQGREAKPRAGGQASQRGDGNGQQRPKKQGSQARNGATGARTEPQAGRGSKEGSDMAEGMTLQEQAEVAKSFLEGLVGAFGLEASVEIRPRDEETVELAVQGEELGILVGPRGSTLAAVQDMTRTVVQSKFPSRTDRILVDVAGYRERRVAALARFTQQIAAEVLETGSERALEPMSPADRKVIHDTVNEIDGVETRSEGEEAGRYVVIAPVA